MQKIKLIFFVSLFVSNIYAQQIPNSDFENWTQFSGYQNPTGWDTPNATSSPLNTYTVTQESSIVQSGSKCVKLQTKSVLGMQVPGLITLGTFSVNIVTQEAKIEGGIEFTSRPQQMNGFLQYEPKFSDECFIGVILLVKNGNIWDTIGTGEYRTMNTYTSWTGFTVPITYTSTVQPTHLNVIIMPSDRNNPQPNSTLYIDNLTFSYPSGIQSENTIGVNAYISGQTLFIFAKSTTHIDKIRLYSISGKMLLQDDFSKEIDTGSLSSGIYLLELVNYDGTTSVCKVSVN